MGLSNFTTDDDDDDQNSSGPGGPGSGGPPPPSMAGALQSNDVEDMLINYNKRFKSADPARFRDAVIAQTTSVLISKNKPNPLLVGPAGVGKTRIVEDIARRIATDDPLVPDQLKGWTIYELPLSNLVAGAGMVGQLEQRLTELVDFVSDKKKKAILFIDEIHQIASGGGSKDPVYDKVAQILKPALARGDFRLIGATTTNEAKRLDEDPALARRFSRLIVDELTREQTYQVLLGARASLLGHYNHKVSVSDDVLHEAVIIADENSKTSQHRPDNALTLLDRTMADAVVHHNEQIARAQKAGDQTTLQALQSIPTIKIRGSKLMTVAKKLMTGVAEKHDFSVEEVISAFSKIRGQDEVLDDVVDIISRDQLTVFPRTKPLASMFAGPSGVGKTETAKIIAEAVTGQKPIILSMAEYSEPHTVASIIGSPPGYVGSVSAGGAAEKPFDPLESNPHRVIVLDEFEKAHDKVKQIFLGAFDEGVLKTAEGTDVDFSKAIVIATTNAARDATSKPMTGFTPASAQNQRISQQDLVRMLKDHFAPELLGRFTQIVAFNKLERDIYGEILHAAYQRERARILTEAPKQGRRIPDLDDAALRCAVAESYLPEQGARPAEAKARRLIEDALLSATPRISVQTQSGPGNAVADEDQS